jgi:DNA-binding beta-propeller fold protein YncE
VFDAKADKVVAYISGFGRSDEAAADPSVGMYYAAGTDPSGNFALGVIDAKTNMVAQTIPTSNGAHSVAVDRTNHHVYVPTTKTNGSCRGCILVFAPQ